MKGMASAPVESFTVTVQDGLKTQFTAGALTSTTVRLSACAARAIRVTRTRAASPLLHRRIGSLLVPRVPWPSLLPKPELRKVAPRQRFARDRRSARSGQRDDLALVQGDAPVHAA